MVRKDNHMRASCRQYTLYLHDTLTQKNLVENINKKTKTGFIQIDYYVENANDSFIEEYYIGFEVRKDNRFYITSEILRTKKGNYRQNQFKTVFETKNGSLIGFGTSDVYQLFIGRTQNLLDSEPSFMGYEPAGLRSLTSFSSSLFFIVHTEGSIQWYCFDIVFHSKVLFGNTNSICRTKQAHVLIQTGRCYMFTALYFNRNQFPID